MKTYPIALVGLEHQKIVVIGGGETAFRKVNGLLEAGAQVTVISPRLCAAMTKLHRQGAITVLERAYAPGDLQDTYLAIAATDDRVVNQLVWLEAQNEKCLVNLIDDPLKSNFITPAVVQRGETTLAISTGGASPVLSRCLRHALERWAAPELAELTILFGELRPQIAAWLKADPNRFTTLLQLVEYNLPEMICCQGTEATRTFFENLLTAQPGKDDSAHVEYI